MYIDSHCHINFPELAARLPDIFGKMADNQVSHALCVSVDLPAFMRPSHVAQIETMPRDAAAGKVQRRHLHLQPVLSWTTL